MSHMATLHFIGGKPGAGKTTLARELGRSLPAIVICEDEWIETLGFETGSIAKYREAARRCAAVFGPLVTELLRMGVSVVLDVPANTANGRAWIRSLFETAGVDHVLHWIDGTDAECLANVHRRNAEQPAGVYWGPVSDDQFRGVLPYIVPPSPDENFNVVRRSVAAPGGGAPRPSSSPRSR
jgi:predicted kinase